MENSLFTVLLVVLLFLAFLAVLIYLGIRHQRNSMLKKMEKIGQLGFSAMSEVPAELEEKIKSLFHKREGMRLRLKNTAFKTFPDGALYLFNLEDTSGDDTNTLAENAVFVESRYLSLPRFSIMPKIDQEGMIANLANQLLLWLYAKSGTPISFAENITFNRRYLVTAADERAVRDWFNPTMLERLNGLEGLVVEADGDHFAVGLMKIPQKPGRMETVDPSETVTIALRLHQWFSTN